MLRAARRRLDRGHPGHPVLRAGPRRPRQADRGVPGPRRPHRGLPARLHPRRRRAECGLDEATGHAAPSGCGRSAGCSPAARPASSTDRARTGPRALPASPVMHHEHQHGDRGHRDQHHQRLLQRRDARLTVRAAGKPGDVPAAPRTRSRRAPRRSTSRSSVARPTPRGCGPAAMSSCRSSSRLSPLSVRDVRHGGWPPSVEQQGRPASQPAPLRHRHRRSPPARRAARRRRPRGRRAGGGGSR